MTTSLEEISLKNFGINFTLEHHNPKTRPCKHNWDEAEEYLYLFEGMIPSAFVGWNDVNDINNTRTIWITVIQGVFYEQEPKPVPPRDWEINLVRSLEEFKSSREITQFAISPISSIVWANIGTGEELEKRQIRFYKKYDLTAQKQGYTLERIKSPYSIPELYIKTRN